MPNEKGLLNFHSAEFNRTDDLNDWSGNYRSFESLEGIVTADMRHQKEGLRNASHADFNTHDRPASGNIDLQTNGDGMATLPAPLIIFSRGRTLIIDGDADHAISCARFLGEKKLTCSLLVIDSSGPNILTSRPDAFMILQTDGVSVRGAFGTFTATVSMKGVQKPLSDYLGDEAKEFDLVLDLQSSHSFAGTILPIGYYAPGPDPAELDEALTEMIEMCGQFKKPQFTSFQKTRCFHNGSHNRNCNQCLDVCPVSAIQSMDHTIFIDQYLCQGCGGCALVCPADAIHIIEPFRGEILKRLWNVLQTGWKGPKSCKALVISDLRIDGGPIPPAMDETDDRSISVLEVEQIACIGLDVIFTALASGAESVSVVCGSDNPLAMREVLELQIQIGHAILRGLGLPEETIRFTVASTRSIDLQDPALSPVNLSLYPGRTPMEPTIAPADHSRRTLVRLAVQHLYDQSEVSEPRLILPVGAPFGALAVAGSCTLCMACVGACPSGALSTNGDLPRLLFRESQCHQCGLCEETCPERAIRLLPRLLCDPVAVEVQEVLREVEPFRCVECDRPFASPAMIERMTEKLKGHRMYANKQQMRRLQMCAGCRARDVHTSEDIKLWNT